MRAAILCPLLLAVGVLGIERIEEYQRYDGWFNNLANPDWGTVGSRLHRDSPSNYQDGVYMMDLDLPSAREISDLVFRGPSGIPHKRNITTMFAFFSQVVAYEIMQSTANSCPLEMHKIPVPKCDPVFDSECEGKTGIPFVRAKYDKQTGHGFNSPREQVNERTSWIDASFLYSTQEPWVASLRSFENGTLAEGPMKGYPPFNNPHLPLINPPPPQIHRLMNPERLFILGDSRINENPGLLSFGLILYRWHNIQAKRFQELHPEWMDEEVFQAARRWVIATLQKIVMYDFLPALIGTEDGAVDSVIPPYNKYMPHVPPGISHAFAAAAFRFPHSIVPPALLLRKRGDKCEFREEVGGYTTLRLCQNWWNAQDIVAEYSVDDIVLGMASQIAEAEDNIVVEDLRDYIFGPMHFTRMDVVASSIMRGRDNGIPPYNQMRRAFNLPPRTWDTINPEMYKQNQTLFDELAKLFGGDIAKLDGYVGGMLETDGRGPGQLFTAILKDQFVRLRDSDRFWFENSMNGIFTDEELAEIRNTTLGMIISATTEIAREQLQDNVFYWRDGDPCPQPFQVNSTGLERCVPFMRFDHFTGNEVTYIFTLIGLACVPIVCLGIGYMLVQRRRKMGWDPAYDGISATASDKADTLPDVYSVQAIEWLEEEHCRTVSVHLDLSSAVLSVQKPRGGVLRKITLPPQGQILAICTEPGTSSIHGPFCLIRVPKTHDLVVRLPSDVHCKEFLHTLSGCLTKMEASVVIQHASNDVLLEAADTKVRKQRRLDHFFREAYSRAFNRPELSDSSIEYHDDDELMKMTLTRHELADAIGMREDALFVQRMFAVASEGKDTLSFHAFLQIIRKFSDGSTKEKLGLLFQMCDRQNTGLVERREFAAFIKSLNVVAGVKIDDDLQHDVIDNLLYRSGVAPDSDYLTYKDFEAIFSQREDLRRPVGVDFRGAKMKVNLEETASLNSFAVPSGPDVACLAGDAAGTLMGFLETNRQHIVCLFLFFSINILIFIERFWHYRYETEHRDLRRVMGAGIAITRGAAGSLSFCMALILLTVCRNVITVVRETPLGEYLPFDSAIAFHKIVAITAAWWAAVHTIGHCVNFYHVATQSQEGLHCLFQEAVFGSNFLPTINYWFYGNITGITGLLLVCVMCIIYVFALPCFMRRAYHAFRLTHLLNIAFYALTVLHGLPKLLDSPKFWYYVIGPIIVFIIDRIIGMRQEYKKLQILNAAILPSDIIYLQFKRPSSFKFKSGQWIRISSPSFKGCGFNEHHAFSLASAPQAPTLELYIKAVGPWTWKLRSEIMKSQATASPYPLVHLTGPYGDGNQEWQKYDVAILIGGGIGVTPYASTLTDLVLETSSGKHNNIKCKKVYYLWICPSHKNYEWFVDVLKDVEELDNGGLLETHIFVTQFFHKFDLRTTMLYICEKHFRGDHSGVSMFTGLRAHNHFGRPNFPAFFKFIQNRHNDVSDIGVFSCGPATVNNQIRAACAQANRVRDAPSFDHRFETF